MFLPTPSKAILLLSCIAAVSAFSSIVGKTGHAIGRLHATQDEPVSTRRHILFSGTSALVFFGAMRPASSFSNKISDKYDDRPKRRGPQPKDLGVGTRKDMVGEAYTGLKNCGAAPNCFCSTDSKEDDPEHHIPAWIWPKDMEKETAFQQLEETVRAYKPGQGNIDGGGFQIVESKPGYLYCQFEALKNGYIDDFEVAFIDGMGENTVQVRSSSRVGYLDYGVNAKRVNFLAKALREKGWTAVGVDLKTHVDYALQNQLQ